MAKGWDMLTHWDRVLIDLYAERGRLDGLISALSEQQRLRQSSSPAPSQEPTKDDE